MAILSLLCSILGLLGALSMLLMRDYFNRMASSNAGLGTMGVGAYILLWGSFCLIGVVVGAIALYRVRRGTGNGRALGWMGIALGSLPFVLLVLWAAPWVADDLWFRVVGLVPK